MSDTIKAFECASADGIVDSADWKNLLNSLTISDWRQVTQTYVGTNGDSGKLWVEERADEFVVHNNKDIRDETGLTAAVLKTSDWLAPIAVPAAALGVASLLKMTAPGKLIMLGAGALAGIGWSLHRMDRQSELKLQAVPLHIPKSEIPSARTPDSHPINQWSGPM